MTKASKHQIDMTTGAPLPKLLRFALPMMATNILQLMFAAADSIVVGRFAGEESLAAVGATVSLISLLTNLFLGLSVGANVAAAKYFGLGDEDSLSETVHTSILISAIIGVFLTVIGLCFTEQLLVLMKTPEDILPLSVKYLRIYFIGMTAMTIYNFAAALMRAVGDTARPLVVLFISGGLNVGLNLVFVISLGLGVTGVALSTCITQTLSAVLLLVLLSREEGGMKLQLSRLKIQRQKLLEIVRIGIPAGLQSSMYSISNVVIQTSINVFGKTTVAANTAAVTLEDIIYFTLNAVMQAVTSFVGQNYGPRNFDRIKRVMQLGIATVLVTGLTLSTVELLFASELVGIYSDSAEVIAIGVQRLWIIVPLYFLCGVQELFIGGMRGIGYSILPTVVSLCGICLIRIGFLTTLFNLPMFHTPTAIYALYPFTWLVTVIAEGACFIIAFKRVKRRHEEELSLR